MEEQVVEGETARQLHTEALTTIAVAVWVIMADQADYPGTFVARLVTTSATPYALVADSLAELRDALPRGLDHSDRTPADPKGVAEL